VIFRRDLRALQHAITKVQPYLTGPIRLANIRPEDAIRRPTYVLRPNIIFIPAFGFSAQLALAGGGIRIRTFFISSLRFGTSEQLEPLSREKKLEPLLNMYHAHI
jgi:hypothetical protein